MTTHSGFTESLKQCPLRKNYNHPHISRPPDTASTNAADVRRSSFGCTLCWATGNRRIHGQSHCSAIPPRRTAISHSTISVCSIRGEY